MTPTFDNFFLKLLWTLPAWWKFHHPFSGSSWEITLLLWHLWPLNFDPMTSKLNRFFLISLWRHPSNLVRMRSFVLELAGYFMIFKTSNCPNHLKTLTSWPQLLTISFRSYYEHILPLKNPISSPVLGRLSFFNDACDLGPHDLRIELLLSSLIINTSCKFGENSFNRS